MGDQIGSIVPGLQADIIALDIALDRDPLKDNTDVRRVVFVMQGGVVYKNAAGGVIPLCAASSLDSTFGSRLGLVEDR